MGHMGHNYGLFGDDEPPLYIPEESIYFLRVNWDPQNYATGDDVAEVATPVVVAELRRIANDLNALGHRDCADLLSSRAAWLEEANE